MARKLFGESIKPACRYCLYCEADGNGYVCDKKGNVSASGKCIRFKYDPLSREPELPPVPAEHSPDEFKL